MSVALDQPPTINYQRPFFGGTLSWIGKSEAALVAASKAVINDFKALVNPAEREINTFQAQAASETAKAAEAVGDVYHTIVGGAKSVLEGVGSKFNLLIWGVIAVAIIYALSAARAILPAK